MRGIRDEIALYMEGPPETGQPIADPSPLAAAYVDVAAWQQPKRPAACKRPGVQCRRRRFVRPPDLHAPGPDRT
jgi:hypothetical protein